MLGIIPVSYTHLHQITGQMSIQDVLEEWEKTRHAAEIALKEARCV